MTVAFTSMAHHHADAYCRILRGLEGVSILGFADNDKQRGQEYAAAGLRRFDSLQALLDASPDAVLVCSETSLHAEHVCMAARAGCAVLCEKPLSVSLDEAETMMRVVRDTGVPFMTAFPMRFSAPVMQAAAAIRMGALGRIHCINGRNQGQIPSSHRSWFTDRSLAGGGAVMDHTVHLADLYRWMLRREVVDVYARANSVLHADEAEVETGGLIMLGFTEGSFASIDCSWSRPHRYPTWGGLAMEIVAEHGVMDLDAFSQNIDSYGDSSCHHALVPWNDDANAAMIRAFVEAVRTGHRPSPDLDDGMAAQRIVDAVYRSIKSDSVVTLYPQRV